MKKYILIAGFAMSIAFSACGGGEQKEEGATDTTAVTEADSTGIPDDTLTDKGAGTDPEVGRSSPDAVKPDGGDPGGNGDGEKTGTDGGDKQ